MARLISVVSRTPVDMSVSIGKPTHIMGASHGWGIGWYEKGEAHMKKGIRSSLDASRNQPIQLSLFTNILLCHLRQATSGAISKQNTHPFSYNNYIFAHIGSIHKEILYKSLTSPYNQNFQSEPIDSEVYFRYILQQIQKEDPLSGIQKTVQLLTRSYGANFILSDGETVYAYRYGKPLYWLRWNIDQKLSFATKTGISFQSTQLASQPAYVISSEKIFDGNWNTFDDGELFVVYKNLQYELYPLLSKK